MEFAPVTSDMLKTWSENYQNDPQRQLAALALSKTDVNSAAYDTAKSFDMKPIFSIDIPTMDVTNQKSSGRCWLFAATNVLRERIAKEKDLESFELSQSAWPSGTSSSAAISSCRASWPRRTSPPMTARCPSFCKRACTTAASGTCL